MKYKNNPLTGKPDQVSDSITDIGNLETLFVDTKDPTGFVDPNNLVVTYDSTDRTVTVTHSSGSIEYYWRGIKYELVSPWTSSAHTNSVGRYFLYSNNGTTFAWSTTVWTYDQIQVAIANFQTADKFGLSETHGLMQWQAHQEAHDLLGTYRVSGGSLTAGTYAENTATDAATTPGFDAAVIKDEDVSHTLAAWTQGTYTTLYIGASSAPTFDTAATFPFRSSGSYILVNDPATGAETASATNQFVNVYQVLIPTTDDTTSKLYQMVMLQPQKVYTSLAAAQAEDSRGLSFGTLSGQTPEYVIYARITYSLSAGNLNTGKCRIATGGVTYITGSRQGQTSSGGFTPGPSASAKYLVQTADTSVPNAQDMSALATGIVKNTTGTGVQSIAVAGDLPVLWTTPAYSSGDFTANGSMTWTVDAGDVTTYQYIVIGKMMTVNWVLNTTTVGGTPNSLLYLKIPGSYVSAKATQGAIFQCYDNDTTAQCFSDVTAGGTLIRIFKYVSSGSNNWSLATNTTYIYGSITFEIQ